MKQAQPKRCVIRALGVGERMMDQKVMRSLLEEMERAAEETLQQDAAFHEALLALKFEIDSDPRVQATVGQLLSSGRRVFNSFVPHVRIRVRTEQGVYALPKIADEPPVAASEDAHLRDELNRAASEVIRNSPYHRELDTIINEVVGSNRRFEGIAGEFERQGYEVLLCLDLSAYAQIQGSARPARQNAESQRKTSVGETSSFGLSSADVKFLRALKIRAD
jgi:hypothetical protein